MGGGEIVGNQSVHWRIDHSTGAPLGVNQGNPNRPTGDHQVNMSDRAQGRDPKNVDYFDVTLRFEARRGTPDPVDQLNEAPPGTSPSGSSLRSSSNCSPAAVARSFDPFLWRGGAVSVLME